MNPSKSAVHAATRGRPTRSVERPFPSNDKGLIIPLTKARGHTVFGTVAQGLDIVGSIAEGGTMTGTADGRPALSVIITKVTAS